METLYERVCWNFYWNFPSAHQSDHHHHSQLKPLNKKTPQLPKLSKKWKVGEELNELQTWLIAISRMEGIYRTEAMRAFMEGGDISVKGPPGAAIGVAVGAPIAVRHVSHVTADDLRGPKYPWKFLYRYKKKKIEKNLFFFKLWFLFFSLSFNACCSDESMAKDDVVVVTSLPDHITAEKGNSIKRSKAPHPRSYALYQARVSLSRKSGVKGEEGSVWS